MQDTVVPAKAGTQWLPAGDAKVPRLRGNDSNFSPRVTQIGKANLNKSLFRRNILDLRQTIAIGSVSSSLEPRMTLRPQRPWRQRCEQALDPDPKRSAHMHELSVCEALLAQVKEVAREHGASGVRQITVAVGPLSGIEPTLLAGAFQMARTSSCAAQAELVFEFTAVRVRCTECGAESACVANRLLCAECGGYHTRVVSGDELRLLRVELTSEDEQCSPLAH